MTLLRNITTILLVTLFITACSSPTRTRTPAPVVTSDGETSTTTTSKRPIKQTQTSSAVSGLLKNAKNLNSKGKSPQAAALLERALRIEPRNAHVWNQLAQVRYTQKRYKQAESLALRSNQYAGQNRALRKNNWNLIADARAATGNNPGAATARKRASDL